MDEKYQKGVQRLASHLAATGDTLILLGGSAAHLAEELEAIGCRPRIIKSPSRRENRQYCLDVANIVGSDPGSYLVAEDYTLTGNKIETIARSCPPNVNVVAVVGYNQSCLPNCRVIELSSDEPLKLHQQRFTPFSQREP